MFSPLFRQWGSNLTNTAFTFPIAYPTTKILTLALHSQGSGAIALGAHGSYFSNLSSEYITGPDSRQLGIWWLGIGF